MLLESFYVDEEFEDATQTGWGFDSQVTTGIKEELQTPQPKGIFYILIIKIH